MSRIEDAIHIQGLALRIIEALGIWEETNAGRILTAELGPFSFLYVTPFQHDFQRHVDHAYGRAGLSAVRPPPYELNVWFQGKKVLLLNWDSDGRATLVSFRRGAWETDPVLTHSSLATTPGERRDGRAPG